MSEAKSTLQAKTEELEMREKENDETNNHLSEAKAKVGEERAN